jgi:hypothetical protein
MPVLPGFVGPSYTSQARMVAGERAVNLITEDVKGAAPKARRAYLPAPGVTTHATLPDAPGRGIFADGGRLFSVFGSTVFEVYADGSYDARGNVLNDGMPAQMTSNGVSGGEVGIASGTKGYMLDRVTNIVTLEVDDITQIGQVDTFFVALDTVTGTLKISEDSDGFTWDPSQIAQRSATPDDWIAMAVKSREIYLWGEKTGEVWRNAGRNPFPFALRGDASHEVGIAAVWSPAPLGQGMAWLGQTDRGSGGVYRMNGYTPEKISPEGLDWEIQTYKDSVGISDAVGWSYEREGHEFYVLSFIAAGKTWVYDTSNGDWTERGLWSSLANDFTPYRPQFHAQAFGKNLVCDRTSNKIYSFSSSVYTDVGGVELRRLRQTPHLSSENKLITFHSFELEADRGVGTLAGQGVDPQVELSWSNNGGMTFGATLARSVGRRGAFDTRIRWAPCGAARDRVWRLTSSDPAPTRWYDAYFSGRVGRI